jgi:hypothetical protein
MSTIPENPGIYPRADDIIPYSPRKKFGFASNQIPLETMKGMSLDKLIQLYKNGYTISDENEVLSSLSSFPNSSQTNSLNQKIVSAQGVTISDTALILIGIAALGYFVYKKFI